MATGWPAVLTEGNVTLRPLRRSDSHAWLALRSDSATWLEPWDATSPVPVPGPRPTFGQFVRSLAAQARTGAALPFAIDYRGLSPDGEGAMVLVWQRDGDKVRLFWSPEGGEETADPGFDPHLAPDPTPLWNILDWTPEGRGKTWYPKLEYGS